MTTVYSTSGSRIPMRLHYSFPPISTQCLAHSSIRRNYSRKEGKKVFHPFLPPFFSNAALPIAIDDPSMESHSSSLHGFLGGGLVADVVLWRRKNVSIGVLVGMLAAWVIFYKSGYTLMSFLSNVLLLLLSILFVWAKAAGVLNRPLPPIPKMTLSEEVISKAAVSVGSCMNRALSVFEDIALGKDSKLFYRVAACLLLTSIIGSLTDFCTFGYLGLLAVLTIPVVIEKYRECIHGCIKNLLYPQVQTCERISTEYFDKVKHWILEQKKLI